MIRCKVCGRGLDSGLYPRWFQRGNDYWRADHAPAEWTRIPPMNACR